MERQRRSRYVLAVFLVVLSCEVPVCTVCDRTSRAGPSAG